MLPRTKFQVNWPFGSGEEAKIEVFKSKTYFNKQYLTYR